MQFVHTKISIVVVTRNRPEAFEKCMAACKEDIDRGAELVVVDDCSNVPYVSNLRDHPRVIRNARRLFLSASRNAGARASSRPYVLFVDDDNILGKNAAEILAATLDSCASVAVAAPLISAEDGHVWYAGGSISRSTSLAHFDFKGRLVGSVPKRVFKTELFHSCFMVRREVLLQLSGFDSARFPMYLAEADLSERLRRRSYKIAVNTSAEVIHLIGGRGIDDLSRSSHITEPARAYFVGRNRILFERIHATTGAYLTFLLLFEPTIAIFHVLSIMSSGRRRHGWSRLLRPYLRGVLDGLRARVEFENGN